MSNDLVVNDTRIDSTVLNAIDRQFRGASRLDIAVSYLQVSGWNLLEPIISRIDPSNIRILITDQFCITHPEALRQVRARDINIRNYSGSRVYHPKVFIGYRADGRPTSAIIGSANLSESGLRNGIEAGVIASDAGLLTNLTQWFDRVFRDNQTCVVDEQFIASLDKVWSKAAAKRLEILRLTGRGPAREPGWTNGSLPDVDVLQDVLSSVSSPIVVLNIDQAGNNIRNLHRLAETVSSYPDISTKQRSELHLLGLLDSETDELTDLGISVSGKATSRAIADVWCKWVCERTDQELREVNVRLIGARNAAARFWALQPSVRKYFFDNLAAGRNKRILETIELLCNGSQLSEELSIEDIILLSRMILKPEAIPGYIRTPVSEYYTNKGARGWDLDDRKTMLEAWRRAFKHSV